MDLPSYKMVIFQFAMLNYQRVHPSDIPHFGETKNAPDVGSNPPFCHSEKNPRKRQYHLRLYLRYVVFHLHNTISFVVSFEFPSYSLKMFQLKYHFSCFNHHPQSISIFAIESRAIRGYITVSDIHVQDGVPQL